MSVRFWFFFSYLITTVAFHKSLQFQTLHKELINIQIPFYNPMPYNEDHCSSVYRIAFCSWLNLHFYDPALVRKHAKNAHWDQISFEVPLKFL